jgi:hypothetical protein
MASGSSAGFQDLLVVAVIVLDPVDVDVPVAFAVVIATFIVPVCAPILIDTDRVTSPPIKT